MSSGALIGECKLFKLNSIKPRVLQEKERCEMEDDKSVDACHICAFLSDTDSSWNCLKSLARRLT